MELRIQPSVYNYTSATMRPRVAVIGAGMGGLAATKCCLEEELEPECFEKADFIGGLWHYTDKPSEGEACVTRNTVSNVSKEMMTFSDFPTPPDFPVYMPHKHVDRYLNMYTDAFNLRPHIKLKTEVINVQEAEDYAQTGRWDVTTKNLDTGATCTRTYDGVIISTGLFTKPHVPTFPGQERFEGKRIHANAYKTARGFEGQRVLMVGNGNSSLDIAVDLCSVTDQVYISARCGTWLLGRVSSNGDPLDMSSLTRFTSKILAMFPGLFDTFFMSILNKRFNHYRYGLSPKYPPSITRNLVINDDLPQRILTGAIQMHAGIETFTESGARFTDGREVDDIDTVILGTGYEVSFPFLSSDVVGEDISALYKVIFPPDRKHHTLAVVGCCRVRGSVVAVTEMQCRVAARVLSGRLKLPDRKQMWACIHRRKSRSAALLPQPFSSVVPVDYSQYMDELGEFLGCKPSLGRLLVTDPRLALKCIFDSQTPFQYRLTGPGSWSGARAAIMTQWDRVYAPLLAGRPQKPITRKSSGIWKFVTFVIGVAILYRLMTI